jgi:hypothetical protein
MASECISANPSAAFCIYVSQPQRWSHHPFPLRLASSQYELVYFTTTRHGSNQAELYSRVSRAPSHLEYAIWRDIRLAETTQTGDDSATMDTVGTLNLFHCIEQYAHYFVVEEHQFWT